MEIWFTWDDEIHELKRQEAQMYRHHQDAARCREKIAERQRYLLQKDVAWFLSCWRGEVQELIVQEENVGRNHRNAARYKKLVAWHAVLEKCRGLSTETTHGRRLCLWTHRVTRWMVRYTRTIQKCSR